MHFTEIELDELFRMEETGPSGIDALEVRPRRQVCAWMFATSQEGKIAPESYFSGVTILDSYCDKVGPDHYTVRSAAAALLIASKYHDGIQADEADFVCQRAGLAPASVAKAEAAVCSELDFDIASAFSLNFLRWFSFAADGWNTETRSLAKAFLVALSVSAHSRWILPSAAAAGALYLAKGIRGTGHWNIFHDTVCRLSRAQVTEAAHAVLDRTLTSLENGHVFTSKGIGLEDLRKLRTKLAWPQ
jgi:G2/mitotic-specific cyclin 3/4